MDLSEKIRKINEGFEQDFERASTNVGDILGYIAKNCDQTKIPQFLADLGVLGNMLDSCESGNDLASMTVVISQMLLRNREMVEVFLKCPEIDVKFV